MQPSIDDGASTCSIGMGPERMGERFNVGEAMKRYRCETGQRIRICGKDCFHVRRYTARMLVCAA